MHDILELPEVRRLVSRMSVAAYHDLCEACPRLIRSELVRGIIMEKVRKTPQHSFINSKLGRAISAQAPAGYLVRNHSALTLADSEVEPDVSIVAGAIDDFVTAHPATAKLAVEVATGRAELERELTALYAEAGVQEYWIILAERQEVEVYRQPEGGQYREVRTYTLAETIECASVPEIRVELAAIFPG